MLEVVEAAAAAREPEQAPETDGVAQVLEPANKNALNTNCVITANQRGEGARAADEHGQEVRANVTEFVFGNLFFREMPLHGGPLHGVEQIRDNFVTRKHRLVTCHCVHTRETPGTTNKMILKGRRTKPVVTSGFWQTQRFEKVNSIFIARAITAFVIVGKNAKRRRDCV